MKRIDCPHCGLRDEIEFTFGGEAHIARPMAMDGQVQPEAGAGRLPDTSTCSDEQWRDYLFTRRNPRGLHHERWCHTYGCGQWFHIARDTLTHRIERVYGIDEGPGDAPR